MIIPSQMGAGIKSKFKKKSNQVNWGQILIKKFFAPVNRGRFSKYLSKSRPTPTPLGVKKRSTGGCASYEFISCLIFLYAIFY